MAFYAISIGGKLADGIGRSRLLPLERARAPERCLRPRASPWPRMAGRSAQTTAVVRETHQRTEDLLVDVLGATNQVDQHFWRPALATSRRLRFRPSGHGLRQGLANTRLDVGKPCVGSAVLRRIGQRRRTMSGRRSWGLDQSPVWSRKVQAHVGPDREFGLQTFSPLRGGQTMRLVTSSLPRHATPILVSVPERLPATL